MSTDSPPAAADTRAPYSTNPACSALSSGTARFLCASARTLLVQVSIEWSFRRVSVERCGFVPITRDIAVDHATIFDERTRPSEGRVVGRSWDGSMARAEEAEGTVGA